MPARGLEVASLERDEAEPAVRLEVAGVEPQHCRPFVAGELPVTRFEVEHGEERVRADVRRMLRQPSQAQAQRRVAPPLATTGITVIPSCWRAAMANILVRNLDDEVLKQLKSAAKAHGRSLQAEIHDVLRSASARRLAETRRLSTQWLKRLGGSRQTDSATLIREDRDTR